MFFKEFTKFSFTVSGLNENVLVTEITESHIEYYDFKNDYYRIYYFPDTVNKKHLEKILLYDEDVKKYIDIPRFLDFLLFAVGNETEPVTQEQAIDYILDRFAKALQNWNYVELDEPLMNGVKEAILMWAEIYPACWW